MRNAAHLDKLHGGLGRHHELREGDGAQVLEVVRPRLARDVCIKERKTV